MITVPKMNLPADPPPYRIPRLDGGLNLRDEQSNIQDNQSPYSRNLTADDRGALSKRPGQELLYLISLGAGEIHLYVDYRKTDGTVKTLLHHGTKLYTQDGTSQPVQIYTGLSDQEGAAFVFNDLFHYVLPSGIIQYDGTTVSVITSYIPTVLENCDPATAGTGDTLEDQNFLSNSWKQKYSYTTAGVTVFYLKESATTVDNVWVYGSPVTFTFDGVNKVTLTTGVNAGTNHVVIQATKIGLMDPNNIIKCRYHAEYGGENDTRIHLTGHPEYPATVYRSGVMDPAYWPENSSGAIGNDSDKNTGLLVHYTNLLLLKERSIWRCDFSLTEAGKPVFDWRPINSFIGCDIPKSIQLINNAPVFANTYAGVHILTSTLVRDEKNVQPISGNINGAPTRQGFLDEAKADLLVASSVDFDGKYLLNVGSNVYVWDYSLYPYQGDERILAWDIWDNFNANVWLLRDRELYYGKRDIGEIVHIMRSTSLHADIYHRLNDFGEAINGVWRSKLFHFGWPEWLKTIREVFFRTREAMNTRMTLNALDKEGQLVGSIPLISASFSWSRFSWSLFSWSVRNVPPTFKLKRKYKDVVYWQFEISNNEINQDLSIMDLEIYYSKTKKVR
jgi:hypothetical protein